MLEQEKVEVLNSIRSEDELRTELVIPLLKKMNIFSEVLDNQGPDEAGVDVICVATSPFKKPEYTAIILKKGNITLKVSDQKNNLINIVTTQVKEALAVPMTHPKLPSESIHPSRVIVLTNGTISRSAELQLRRSFSNINLDLIGQDRIIEQLDQYWPKFYDDRRPFLSSYALKLFSSLNVVDLEEFGYTKRKRSLDDIYIDALLTEEDSIAAKDDFTFDKFPISGEKLCKEHHDLIVVTCGPGGGKTTLLKEIAISQSKANKDCVAVYLHARDVLESKDLITTAATVLSELSKDSVQDVYEEIKNIKLLLLVDGLDELALLGERESVIARLIEANKTIGARVILGSRPESNPSILAALSKFKAYSISPLGMSQIRSFFGKWFKDNIDKASKLLGALEDKGIFDKLPKTPMTMTLVAIVYESQEDIPSTLTELYEMFVELLTGKWDANRKISSAFDSQMKLAFLARLAWAMQSERLDTISQDRCIELAESFFANEATLDGVNVREFIQSIIDRSHILIPTGRDQLRFSHMTFQEYFCAEYLSHDYPSNATIETWFGDDWWKEVLFFLAGKKKNISNLIDVLLTSNYNEPSTRITKFTTLGSMLQAGSLTNAKQKNEAVNFASQNFLRCLEDIKAAIESTKNEKLKRSMTRWVLLGTIEQLFSSNFTSTYLKQALIETYANQPPGKEYESARFFLASSLAKIGIYEPLLEFATDPEMIDTAMFMLAGSNLVNQNLSDSEKEKYRKFKKRISDFRKSIQQELKPVLSLRPKRQVKRSSSKKLIGNK